MAAPVALGSLDLSSSFFASEVYFINLDANMSFKQKLDFRVGPLAINIALHALIGRINAPTVNLQKFEMLKR